MKRSQLIRSAVSLILALAVTGCSSLSGYFVDRGRDAADVLTLSAGIGAIGQIRLGPLPLGLLDTSDAIGLRYGELFCRAPSGEKPDEHDVTLATLPAAPIVLFFGAIGSGWDGVNDMWVGSFERLDDYRIYENNFPLSATQLRRNKGTGLLGSPNCYQIEGVLGFGLTLRVGVNVGELLDFMLGWSTFDIFEDDIGVGLASEVATGLGAGLSACDAGTFPQTSCRAMPGLPLLRR